MNPVYFDHNASAPLDPSVLAVMMPFLTEHYGNASSRHIFGVRAKEGIRKAREQVAATVGVQASQVIFTASGTEANNMFLRGLATTVAQLEFARAVKPVEAEAPRLLISAIEHSCVWRPAEFLKARGWHLDMLPVNAQGQVRIDEVSTFFTRPAVLCSVMLANNETGVLQPVAQISALARSQGVCMHTDAAQAFGKVPVNFPELQVQAMSLSAHKIGGPQGVGALVIDKRLDFSPWLFGGGQEAGLRSGTENVAGIVGFGEAAEQAVALLEQTARHVQSLTLRLEKGLQELGACIFGAGMPRLPNTTYFAFPGVVGETLMLALDAKGFAVGVGAACTSQQNQGSRTLLAMGYSPELAASGVRVSLGRSNTLAEVEDFLVVLRQILAEMHGMTALTSRAA